MKRMFLAFVMAFTISLGMSVSAYAAKTPSIQKIADSVFRFSKDTLPQTKWVLLTIAKGEKKDQIIVEAKNARVSKTIYLKNGAGIYDIQIAESSASEKYGSGYFVRGSLSVENFDQRDMSFLLPSDLVQSDNEEIIALAKTITEDARDQLDAVRKIHKYIAKNIKYDYDAYKDGSYVTKPYDAVSTLKSLKGVCAAYADLYAAMVRAIGIKAKVIYGIGYLNTSRTESGDHAWNEVFVNNEWKSVDATWDSTTERIFKYFDIAEEVFDQDHQKLTEQDI